MTHTIKRHCYFSLTGQTTVFSTSTAVCDKEKASPRTFLEFQARLNFQPKSIATRFILSSDRVIYHGFAGPVELSVVDVAASLEQITEHASQLVVVWSLEEVQPADVAEVSRQLLRMPFA